MIHFLYLNYGPRDTLRQELKYSFLTLRPFLDPTRHRVAIYTDAPARFAAWPVATVSIAGKIEEYSAGGRFNHRIKLMVMRDAVARFGDAILLDSDSIVFAGFPGHVANKLRGGAVMNRFELHNPAPELAGFTAMLPHAGPYRYDPARSHMFNSGLIGAHAAHAPILDDAIALTDALLDAPYLPASRNRLEQLAMSEAFRIHGIAIAEIHDSFLHYWKRSWRRYAEWRLRRILPRDWDDLRPPVSALTFNAFEVFLHARLHSLRKRLP